MMVHSIHKCTDCLRKSHQEAIKLKKAKPVLFRPRLDQAEKLQRLAGCTGGNLSEALRQLVDCAGVAEVTITRPTIHLDTTQKGQEVTNGQ